MHLLKRCALGLSVSVIVLLSAAVPVSAFAQYYYDSTANYSYGDCGVYDSSYYGIWNRPCNVKGALTVFVQVNNRYDGYRSPSDFTIYVSGASPAQQYFAGSQHGTTVRLTGSYSVSVYNQVGYTPTYSSDCSGSLAANENRTCYVTLTSSYTDNYPYHYPPYQNYPYNYLYQQPVVYQPVTYAASYAPSLPSTGFEPVNKVTFAFALALLFTLGVFFFPYVRKSFTAIVR